MRQVARAGRSASALTEGLRALASARALRPLYECALIFQGAEDGRDSEDRSCAEGRERLLKVESQTEGVRG
jgi:hypothetical protein